MIFVMDRRSMSKSGVIACIGGAPPVELQVFCFVLNVKFTNASLSLMIRMAVLKCEAEHLLTGIEQSARLDSRYVLLCHCIWKAHIIL